MDQQLPQQPQQIPASQPFFKHKGVLIGVGAIVILLVILGLTSMLIHSSTNSKMSVTPTQSAQGLPVSKTAAPQVIVVSDASNLTLAKVDTATLEKAIQDSHLTFASNIHTVVIHLTITQLPDQSGYMQSYMDTTHKIVQGGFYATTNGKEDIYIYRNPSDLHTSSPSLISYGYWVYTADALSYLANVTQYHNASIAQMEALQKGQYQFVQAHNTSPFTVTVE